MPHHFYFSHALASSPSRHPGCTRRHEPEQASKSEPAPMDDPCTNCPPLCYCREVRSGGTCVLSFFFLVSFRFFNTYVYKFCMGVLYIKFSIHKNCIRIKNYIYKYINSIYICIYIFYMNTHKLCILCMHIKYMHTYISIDGTWGGGKTDRAGAQRQSPIHPVTTTKFLICIGS